MDKEAVEREDREEEEEEIREWSIVVVSGVEVVTTAAFGVATPYTSSESALMDDVEEIEVLECGVACPVPIPPPRAC